MANVNDPNEGKRLRMLVCIIGTLRGGNKPAESIRKYILQPFDADLALCTGTHKEHLYKQMAKFVWEFDQPKDWSVIWDEVGTKWRSIKRDLNSPMWGGIDGKGSGAIIFALRYLLKKMLIKHDLVSKYDIFYITRSDQIYVNSHLPCSPGVHVPSGQNYKGISDRNIVVDSSNVIQSLSILEYINNELPKIGSKNPERVLKDFFDHSGFTINRFPRNMFIVMRKDEETSWGTPEEHFEDDLYLKYPYEYYEIKGKLTIYRRAISYLKRRIKKKRIYVQTQ